MDVLTYVKLNKFSHKNHELKSPKINTINKIAMA